MISIGTTILGFLRFYNEKIRPSAPFSPLTVKDELDEAATAETTP